MTTMPCEHRQLSLLAALTACTISAQVVPASAKPLPYGNFKTLAARCAPSVAVATLAAVARSESGLNPLALHDNTTNASIRPSTLGEAQLDVSQLLGDGDSVDIGLMQINSANLPALRMNASDALNPCVSLTGGAAVLKAAYGDENGGSDQNVALLLALSQYNTGTPFKGIMNGYARTVLLSAKPGSSSAPAVSGSRVQALDPNAPPTWNVWASAAYARSHDASWLVTSNADPGKR